MGTADHNSWYSTGNESAKNGNYDDALAAYDKALEIDPKYANAWYNKANALRNFGQSLVDKANDDRTNAPKLVNRSIALFDSADKCYDMGDVLSGKKQ